ncbi:energy transducer TonB family protein [Hoeflea ulvae]|uniref:TonB family protein n=1 Tax=Hoeflea ulvae TaxID=2983764 RepID=A0ABT3YGC9_9HYPH|nr:TonB family protein [Hoeflea ulvae]MCY0094951.1 TonB family protein [Hoeflea ulvae]
MTSLSKLRLAAILALSGSAVLHVAAMALAPSSETEVLIEGGQATEMAALGSSFADLVKQGDNIEPATPDDVTDSAVQDDPVQPVTADSEAAPVEAKPLTAQPSPKTLQPVDPAKTAVEPASVSANPVPVEALAPSPYLSAFAAPVQVTHDPESPQPALTQPVRTETVTPEPAPVDPVEVTKKAAETSPVKPSETIEAIEEPVLENIPKPIPKPEQVKKPKKKPAKKKPASGQKVANSNTSAKAGSQQGREAKTAAPSGRNKSKSRSSATGNAAASNYPGKIYSKIARTRQKNAGGRGVAHISFKIASNGKATGIAVSRSSGNSRIDRAAVAHVKRASPFPRPPAGAQTRFVIPVEFRR